MKAVVLGTTGYTGLILVRILSQHPDVQEIVAASTSRTEEDIRSVDPKLAHEVASVMATTSGKLVSVDDARSFKPDVVFCALPHLQSAELSAPFLERSVVIDLSADFRFQDRELFRQGYGVLPPREDLLSRSTYGLCEWHRDRIRTSDIIGNPGCYPTATLIPLLPLAKEGLIGDTIIVNAISGISGAGRKAHENYLYCTRSENAGAYLPAKSHRHAPEMMEQLAEYNPGVDLYFTPHLASLKRGIAATTVADLTNSCTDQRIEELYARYYGDSPFVQWTTGRIPQSGDVWGSNRCDIGWQITDRKLFLFSAIDNLIKGASGQAVQNMNIRFGLDERAGLPLHGEM